MKKLKSIRLDDAQVLIHLMIILLIIVSIICNIDADILGSLGSLGE